MTEEKKAVWIVGHKNPDTDSVCAAIAYADLKNKTEEGLFLPKKAGALSSETRYVLERFGIEEPETIYHVGAQIKDIDYRPSEGVSGHYSLRKAWELMRQLDVVTLPIVDEHRFLEGIIVNGDIAYSYMDVMDNHILGRSRTQYKNIIETINGTMVTGNAHAYFTRGKVVVASGNRQAMHREIEDDDLVIVGNIKERQMIALEENASCVIISGNTPVDGDVVAAAKEKECVLITTDYDSFTVARLIHQSMPIRYFMKKDHIVSFQLEDHVDDVTEAMSKIRHRDFPVLDEQQHLVGMVSRRNLLHMKKKRLILVDHNEKSQAVDGIDQAEILEIIDHHRLGSLETLSPIFFRNQPLGCTSTIIYQMYQEKGIAIEPQIAGILCSAILSDTLMFRSPTCTPVDQEVARNLAELAGVEVEELATAMFEAGSDFESRTTEEIIYQDFKTFEMEDIAFGVSQVSAVSRRQLNGIKPALQECLQKVIADKSLKMVFVMLTDIFKEETELIYMGAGAKNVIQQAFGVEEQDGGFMLPNVVSRKKQLIPAIMQAMQAMQG
jgi:manganese-dependent inorganic pyrophosphatase